RPAATPGRPPPSSPLAAAALNPQPSTLNPVLTYLLRRWLLLLPTLFLASILVFAIIQMAPGDPVRMKLGTEATPDQVAAERERLGLNQPVPVRYGVWLSDLARLNLGRSQV